ncbi:MAG: hypothetical protein E6Q36_08425 [Chryseobacterium sp.]|nr:MAG: hypothetical protein E6Q36_08425 [Chryseobacterium sp.]
MANWAHQPGKLAIITLPENNRFVDAQQQHRYLCIIISTAESAIMTLDSSDRVSFQTKKKFIIEIENQRS